MCQQPLTLTPAVVCSLAGDGVTSNIGGAEGAKHVTEALKVNSTLTFIEYAAARPLTFLIRQSVSSR